MNSHYMHATQEMQTDFNWSVSKMK